jgi:N-acetylmuramoyl-L-alanine amidase
MEARLTSMQGVFVSAGHGKSWPLNLKDVGAVGKFGDKKYYERDIAKELGRRVLDILKSKKELKGCLVQGVGIETDANIVRKMAFVNSVIRENRFAASNCLGIAIHMNASTSNKARGFEVWYQKNGKSKPLAEYMVRSWKEYALTPLRPSPLNNSKNGRYGRFYTDDAVCPYLIVETSFISNYEDLRTIVDNLDRAAESLAHGVMEYVRSM